MKGPLGLVDDLIVEHGSSKILKQHLELLREKLRLREEETDKLKQENTTLTAEVRRLTASLQAASTEEFIKHKGVLFQRRPSGQIDDTVYCPKCKGPMFSLQRATPFTCSSCNVVAGFTGRQLQHVINQI